MVETLTPASYQINSDRVQYQSRAQFEMDRDFMLDLAMNVLLRVVPPGVVAHPERSDREP
jgi:hypothetical protein